MLYPPMEMLKTSAVYNRITGEYDDTIIGYDGREETVRPEITLTGIDYKRFHEFYDVYDEQVLYGCYFETDIGLFDSYINHYYEIKMNSESGKRELAKLYLNNLYGKFATSTDSSYKVCYMEDGVLKFYPVIENNRSTVYIPVGSAIVAYARDFTIRHAQDNYNTFAYADTDSLHCYCNQSELINVNIHPTNLGCWKIESEWEEGFFVRQKTYLEKINGEWHITCSGMGKQAKKNVTNMLNNHYDKMRACDIVFSDRLQTVEDFKKGFTVFGNLKSKCIEGGVYLNEQEYRLR